MAQNDLPAATERTMAEARRAIDEEGVTAAGLRRIQDALRRLARTPGLVERSDLRALHRSGSAATVLASEGPEGLTLVLARFPAEAPTPVHDHGTWGVACVVTGRDRYVRWERLGTADDAERAQVRVHDESILEPGDSVYWLEPPDDIHSQQGHGETAWELVLFGCDATRLPRHYFDPATGVVRTAIPQ